LEDRQVRVVSAVCSLPIDLEIDRYTDDEGKSIHERCYLQRIAPTMKPETAATVARMMQRGFKIVVVQDIICWAVEVRLHPVGASMNNGHPIICFICDQPLDLAVEHYPRTANLSMRCATSIVSWVTLSPVRQTAQCRRIRRHNGTTTMTLHSPQCPECLRLEVIEHAAWEAWLEVKGLRPMTEAGVEMRTAALNASYAVHFHRKKCPVGTDSVGLAS